MAEPLVDFVVITAIELERREVCRALRMDDRDRVSKESRVYWRKSLKLRDGEFYNIIVAQSPDMASVDAALLVSDTIHHWHPGAILLVGIAAGVDREKEQFGDLVIGSDVYYYERGKLTPDGKRPEPIMYRADATLWNHVRAVPQWVPPSEFVRPDKTQTHPRINYGVIACGEKVIADAIVRDEITAGHRKIVAIEMEGYGFSAATWQSFERIRHLVIKAICDFAGASKGDNWQRYAAAVAAEFTKHFLLDRPLSPRNRPVILRPNSRYNLIIDNLKSGKVVPFLGPGINSKFYIDLAFQLAEFVRQVLLSGNGENDSQNEQLIKTLIGIPCSICHYWPGDRPPECPILQNIDRVEDSPVYIEQRLAISKINLRYLCQYYILKNRREPLYEELYEILMNLEDNCQPGSLHQFLAEIPHLMLSQRYPRRSPGLPFQLIVTTNYDDMLEKAFKKAQQPFDVVFYVADGDERGKFKHQTYEGALETIKTNEYQGLPLRKPWGSSLQPRPIILKLFGTWKNPWENNFVVTEQQLANLVSNLKQNLPTNLIGILQNANLLFMGYSPSDSDLQILVNCLWKDNKIPTKSWLLHQAQPGHFEQEIWKQRNVELLDIPSSLDDFVAQIKEAIQERMQ